MNRPSASVFVGLILAAAAHGQQRVELKDPEKNSGDEKIAAKLDLQASANFLDSVAGVWTRQRKCGTCHTNYPYLLARPMLTEKGKQAPVYDEIRGFFENRVANWDTAKPRWDTEVIATAATLAINDKLTTGKLHPLTRAALDRMWTLQKENGAWNWLKCDWPPFEHDDYYGAVYAALGAGLAPDGYSKSEKARAGLDKLRKYLHDTPAPDLHHKTWLLWASLNLDGLMNQAERDATIKELLGKQRADGGWSLPALGSWKRHDKTDNDPNSPSDGYATGLVIYVLRQAGVAANEEHIQKGIAWLKSNQRASGRWFTRSLNNDTAHYITNAGTSFAVLALKACE